MGFCRTRATTLHFWCRFVCSVVYYFFFLLCHLAERIFISSIKFCYICVFVYSFFFILFNSLRFTRSRSILSLHFFEAVDIHVNQTVALHRDFRFLSFDIVCVCVFFCFTLHLCVSLLVFNHIHGES